MPSGKKDQNFYLGTSAIDCKRVAHLILTGYQYIGLIVCDKKNQQLFNRDIHLIGLTDEYPLTSYHIVEDMLFITATLSILTGAALKDIYAHKYEAARVEIARKTDLLLSLSRLLWLD